MVGTVDTVERVLEHGKFRAYVSNLLIDYPKVELIIRNDASFNLSKAGIGMAYNTHCSSIIVMIVVGA